MSEDQHSTPSTVPGSSQCPGPSQARSTSFLAEALALELSPLPPLPIQLQPEASEPPPSSLSTLVPSQAGPGFSSQPQSTQPHLFSSQPQSTRAGDSFSSFPALSPKVTGRPLEPLPPPASSGHAVASISAAASALTSTSHDPTAFLTAHPASPDKPKPTLRKPRKSAPAPALDPAPRGPSPPPPIPRPRARRPDASQVQPKPKPNPEPAPKRAKREPVAAKADRKGKGKARVDENARVGEVGGRRSRTATPSSPRGERRVAAEEAFKGVHVPVRRQSVGTSRQGSSAPPSQPSSAQPQQPPLAVNHSRPNPVDRSSPMLSVAPQTSQAGKCANPANKKPSRGRGSACADTTNGKQPGGSWTQRVGRVAQKPAKRTITTDTEAEPSSPPRTVSSDLTEVESDASDTPTISRPSRLPTTRPSASSLVMAKVSRANLSAPLSSPRKSSCPSFPMSSQHQLAAQLDRAEVETLEQRAKGWGLGKMDQLVWVAVEVEGGRFWWPADITSEDRNEIPLRVALHADPGREILNFTQLELTLADPSPATILAFRGVRSTARFDCFTFREGTLDEDNGPTDEVFEKIRKLAVELEDQRENQTLRSQSSESDSDGGALTAPNRRGNNKVYGKQKLKRRRAKSSSPETVPSSPSSIRASESDDELLRADDPSTKYDFPVVVLVLYRHTHWPVTLTGYDPSTGKFLARFDTGDVVAVAEKAIVTKTNAKFFTVEVGETAFDLGTETLREFVKGQEGVLREMLVDEYEPARRWNAEFFAGGSKRSELNRRLKVGDLREAHTHAVGQAIRDFVTPSNATRPTGSPAYEALTASERNQYATAVLLPQMLVLWTVHDEELEAEATAELLEEQSELGVTEAEVGRRAWEKGYGSLGRMSAGRFVRAARDFRGLGLGVGRNGVRGGGASEEGEESGGSDGEEEGRDGEGEWEGMRRSKRKRVKSVKGKAG